MRPCTAGVSGWKVRLVEMPTLRFLAGLLRALASRARLVVAAAPIEDRLEAAGRLFAPVESRPRATPSR